MEKLLARVKNLILNPKDEWEAIKSDDATIKDIIFNYVAVLAAIPAIASIIGQGIVGFGVMGETMRYPMSYLLFSGILEYVMNIAGILVAGAIINNLAVTFESKKSSVQSLKVAAYAYTPVWLAGALYVMPFLYVPMILISLYGIYLLYLGLSPLMATPDSRSPGYTVLSIIAMIAITVIIQGLAPALTRLFFF
ncbi:MAG TPA: YIP1 family protein [Nitrospiraceae bacterium]|nr:YIP1 family protein [Nitrospiraceae bacterium]